MCINKKAGYRGRSHTHPHIRTPTHWGAHTDYQLCNVKSQVVSTETEYRSRTKNRKAFASISHWEWSRGKTVKAGDAEWEVQEQQEEAGLQCAISRLQTRNRKGSSGRGGTTTFLLTKRRTVERRFSLNISALRAVIPRLLYVGSVCMCVCVWLASILSMSEVCAKGYKTVYTATTRAGRPAGSLPHKILLTPIFVQLFSNNFVMRFACHTLSYRPPPPTNPGWAVINACTLAVVAVQRKCFWPELLSSLSLSLHFPLSLSLFHSVSLVGLLVWFDAKLLHCISFSCNFTWQWAGDGGMGMCSSWPVNFMLYTTIQGSSCKISKVREERGLAYSTSKLDCVITIKLASIRHAKRNTSRNCSTGPRSRIGNSCKHNRKPLKISHCHMP